MPRNSTSKLAFFALSFKLWDMFHVCLLSVVLFHLLFIGLALKLKVNLKKIPID
jgi:hypothetical protein